MTVASSVNRSGPYAGAGTLGPFPIGFYFLDNAHLLVVRKDSAGNEATLALGVDYTALGAGNLAGGLLTLTAVLAFGYTLTIQRNVPLTQLLDYTQSDSFPAESHEAGLDKLTMAVQQIDAKTVGALRVPEVGGITLLPSVAGRAGTVLGFDAFGNPAPVAVQSPGSFTYGQAIIDPFTGDGVQTVYTLSADPGAQSNLDVRLAGITQRPGVDYVWTSGTTVTFTSPPPDLVPIAIKYVRSLPVGAIGANTLTYTQSGIGAVLRSLQDRLREVVSVLDFGADPTGAFECSATFLLAWTSSRNVVMPPGNFKLNRLAIPSTLYQRTLRGSGRGVTILTAAGGDDVILFGSGGVTEHSVELSDFSIQGPLTTTPVSFTGGLSIAATNGTLTSPWALGSGEWPVTFSDGSVRYATLTNGATTCSWIGGLGGAVSSTAVTGGSGIHLPANGGAQPFGFKAARLTINGMGGSAILDRAGAFSSRFEDIDWSQNLGHGLDIVGGNTTTVLNCYAHQMPTAGKAGYRIHGTVVLISCNGVDAGTHGYIFGDNAAEDGVTSYSFSTLINCHVEDHTAIGYRSKTNGLKFINTDALAPATGSVVNYKQDSTNQQGTCDNINLLLQTKGASFLNGCALHVVSGGPMFGFAFHPLSDRYAVYNETDTNAYQVGCLTSSGTVQFLRPGVVQGDTMFSRLMMTTQYVKKRVALAYSASIAVDASLGNIFEITATNTSAFAITAPTNAFDGQDIRITVKNASGSALGTVTPNAAFHLAGSFPTIGNGKNQSLDFTYDGTVWKETSRSAADVTN